MITEDVVYGHKAGLAMVFNVYEPRDPIGLGIIFINSGGWRSPFWPLVSDSDEGGGRLLTRSELEELNPRWGAFRPQQLLDHGYTVFDVRHGSSPRFTVPEIVSDLRRAVRFIRLHAPDFGVDPQRLGLWGGSAGGHLSLMLATASEIRNEHIEDPVESASGQVAAAVTFFPPTDLTRWATPERFERYPAIQFDRVHYLDYSPIQFASDDDPPILIIHGDQDDGVPIEEGRTMYEALIGAGAEAKFVVIEGAGHGFLGNHADRAAAEMVDWFDQHLRIR
jgi:dipeptidyl aminopeptidase/acylaminoacyl peptidase